MNRDILDDALERARSRMKQVGFEVVNERGPEGFGNRVIAWRRGMLSVRAVRERDQLFLTLTTPSGEANHDIGLWESCLDNIQPSLEPRVFEGDLDVLLRRLPELELLIEGGGPVLDECLRESGMWRFSERHRQGLIKPP